MANFYSGTPKVFLEQGTSLVPLNLTSFEIDYRVDFPMPMFNLTGFVRYGNIEETNQTKGDSQMNNTSRSPQYTKKMLVGSQDETNPSIDYWIVTRVPVVSKKVLITVTRVIEFMYAVIYTPTEKGMWKLAGMGVSKCNAIDSFSSQEGARLALYRALAVADGDNKVDNAHRTAFIHKLLEEWNVPNYNDEDDEFCDF